MPKQGQGYMQEARVIVEMDCHHQLRFRISHAPKTRGRDRKQRTNTRPGEEIWCMKCGAMREAVVRVSGLGAEEWRYTCSAGHPGRRFGQSKLKCETAAAKHHLTKHPHHTVTVLYHDKAVHVWEPQSQLPFDENKPPF